MDITTEDDLQKGLIITDDIAINPILDFNSYRDAITNIIKKSHPKFTIGIFGDWGTGKTTLMDSIDKKLQQEQQDLIIVRFDAWRYERENQFALVPLLKTIEYSIPEHKYKGLKEAFKGAGIFGLRISTDFVSGLITSHLGKMAGDVFKKGLDNFSNKIMPELQKVSEIEKNTIYFEGQKKIENAIKEIRHTKQSFRIVVFVDDLDRCSPKKTLEVLESIKMFLGMEGFIYVLGMSHEIVAKLIDIEYKESGVKGEHYIKKMIQIPVTLPKWNNQDIIDLVKDFVIKGIIDNKYKDTINENIELISTAIENNPREIKRFLNNFIVAKEIFSETKNIVAKELLVLQAVQLRWNKFYDLLINSDEEFRKEINRIVQMDEKILLERLESERQEKDIELQNIKTKRMLQAIRTDIELWNFLRKNIPTLNNIKDWNAYRRATEVIKEPTAEVIKEPTAEVIKEPTAEVIKEPTAEVIKEPTAEVIKEPTAEVIKEPTAEVIKEPTAEYSNQGGNEIGILSGVDFVPSFKKIDSDDFEYKIEQELVRILTAIFSNNGRILEGFNEFKTVAHWYKELKTDPLLRTPVITNICRDEIIKSVLPILTNYMIEKLDSGVANSKDRVINEMNIEFAVKPYVTFQKMTESIVLATSKIFFDITLRGKATNIRYNPSKNVGQVTIEKLTSSFDISISRGSITFENTTIHPILKPIKLYHQETLEIEDISFTLRMHNDDNPPTMN